MKYKHLSDLTVGEAADTWREFCGSCRLAKPTVEEQYSFGAYAGRLCRECAIKNFRDACGLLDGKQGDARELDEPLEEDV